MSKEELKKEVERLAIQQAKAKENPRVVNEPVKNLVQQVSWRDMRILWYSVAPWIKSGYGVVTNNMVKGLISRGFPTIIAAYYGIEPGGFLKVGDMVVVPLEKFNEDKLGFSTAIKHYQKFQSDVLIYHTDFWVSKSLADACPRAYCYTPIDHEDYPDQYQDVLRAYKGVAVPSRHAVGELRKYGVEATYIPHGIDLATYKPEPRELCRKYFNLNTTDFIMGIVAANNDKEPRKGWDKMFSAVKIFLDQNPDAKKDFKVFCHTNPVDGRGYNLHQLAKRLNISEYFVFQDPYMMTLGLPDQLLCRIYNCFNVLMNLSKREGFGIPMAEAQACGIPSIVTKFSAMPERVDNGKCGWMIKPQGTHFSPLNAMTAIPDEFGAAVALGEAYNSPKKLQQFSKKGISYSKQFSWDIVLDKHMLPWLENISHEIPRLNKGKEQKIAKNITMVEGYGG